VVLEINGWVGLGNFEEEPRLMQGGRSCWIVCRTGKNEKAMMKQQQTADDQTNRYRYKNKERERAIDLHDVMLLWKCGWLAARR